jgi:hypothetical protein
VKKQCPVGKRINPNCKEVFNVPPCRNKDTNCCSRKCRDMYQRHIYKEKFKTEPDSKYTDEKVDKQCEYCGKTFWVILSMKYKRKYCSPECYQAWRINEIKRLKAEAKYEN